MSDYAFFYNSVNGDRVYDANDFTYWVKGLFTTGVNEQKFEIYDVGGMDIQVGAYDGYVNINGKLKVFDDDPEFTLSPADDLYDRIDTVVLERNDSLRDIVLKVVEGSYYGTGAKPTPPVRQAGIYQLVVAEVFVKAGATTITANDITDKRADTKVCGFLSAVSISVEELLRQIEQININVSTNTTNIAKNATDIAKKANIASPALTGTPTAPTPSATDNSTKIATTNFVKNAISNIGARQTLANTTKTLANKTYVNFGSLTLPAGKWLINGSIWYPAAADNTTGWIYVGENTTGGSNPQTNGGTIISKSSGNVAEKSVVYTLSKNTKINLIGWQNSGASLKGCIGYMSATRII